MAELLADLKIGERIREDGWTFVPLSREKSSRLDYLTLDDAVQRGLATIAELNEAGSVSRMKVINDADWPIFIPDGMTLIGCKQNRVINISILVPAKAVTIIPVSCVEQGRWQSQSASSAPSHLCDHELRRKMCKQSTDSLAAAKPLHVDQVKVWDHVGEVLAKTRTASVTGSYHAAFEPASASKAQRNIPGYRDGACGVAVLRGERILSVDLFDKPATCKLLWPRILQATQFCGEGPSSGSVGTSDIRQFLADCAGSPKGEFNPVGLGVHHRFAANSAVGSALVVEDQVLHLAAFATSSPPAAGETPAPDQQPFWSRLWRHRS